MTDIVIPLGSNSTWQDNELRYALRSIEKYARNYRDIIIIGNKPAWINNIIHIAVDDSWSKERNICEKILAACKYSNLITDRTPVTERSRSERGRSDNDEFLFTNDDIIFLKPIDATRYPFYQKGALYNTIRHNNADDTYQRSLENTFTALLEKDYAQYHFDIHCPIIYDKEHFIQAMAQYDWNIDCGYVIKSLYANTMGITGMPAKDLKINLAYSRSELKQKLSGRDVFSFGDGALTDTFKIMLHEMFPKPSKYERNS